mmetsp:Transcript_104182/g.334229  ORF Transcript_104182/g.334229 Transcript_104182/m.334229 type:complete len:215 (-) Transcript_104182:1231-1875(-)
MLSGQSPRLHHRLCGGFLLLPQQGLLRPALRDGDAFWFLPDVHQRLRDRPPRHRGAVRPRDVWVHGCEYSGVSAGDAARGPDRARDREQPSAPARLGRRVCRREETFATRHGIEEHRHQPHRAFHRAGCVLPHRATIHTARCGREGEPAATPNLRPREHLHSALQDVVPLLERREPHLGEVEPLGRAAGGDEGGRVRVRHLLVRGGVYRQAHPD